MFSSSNPFPCILTMERERDKLIVVAQYQITLHHYFRFVDDSKVFLGC